MTICLGVYIVNNVHSVLAEPFVFGASAAVVGVGRELGGSAVVGVGRLEPWLL